MAETKGREWLLLAVSVVASVALGLGLVRWLAPALLGQPIDLRVVQVDDSVVPFYANIFRPEDRAGKSVIQDPYVGVRLKPMLRKRAGAGPHDLLGFRNLGIPNQADIIVIGDSQTYGTNAGFHDSWPQVLARRLAPSHVYSMATGGWGAVQYLDMFTKSRVFRPRVVVVAFYAGNDPRESFRLAYSVDHWEFLRPDPELGPSDLPRVTYPAPRSEQWQVRLAQGRSMIFTPSLRLASHMEHPGVAAGWQIMADVARRIADAASETGVTPVFAVIPTKERAFAAYLEREGIAFNPIFAKLVEAETRNVALLLERLAAHDSVVIDLLPALEQAVLVGGAVYSRSVDGHPRARGHSVIGLEVARVLRPLLAASPREM